MNNETENIPKKFEILPSFWLVLLGAPSFLVAGYFGYMFQDAIPGFIKTTNSEGFTIDFFRVGMALIFDSAVTWICACIATRCHNVLYQRWFKYW